jgi:hypothetical protein
MRETGALLLLHHCGNALRHCWRGHVTPPHSCVIPVFIAVAWQQARRGAIRHGTAELGSAQRNQLFVYCCVIAGTCFEVTVLAWRKYATIFTSPSTLLPVLVRYSFINLLHRNRNLVKSVIMSLLNFCYGPYVWNSITGNEIKFIWHWSDLANPSYDPCVSVALESIS